MKNLEELLDCIKKGDQDSIEKQKKEWADLMTIRFNEIFKNY